MKKSIWPFCRESIVSLICVISLCSFMFANVRIIINESYRWLIYCCFSVLFVAVLIFLKHTLMGLIAFVDMITKNIEKFEGEIIDIIPKQSSWFSDRFDRDGKIVTDTFFVIVIETEAKRIIHIKSAFYLVNGRYSFTVSKHSSILVDAKGLQL